MGKTVHLRPKYRPKLKYNLNHQIGLLPYRPNLIKDLVSHLKSHGVTKSEFYYDRSIPIGSAKSITADRLLIYAKVFDCSIEELINEPVKAKSFIETPSSKSRLS